MIDFILLRGGGHFFLPLVYSLTFLFILLSFVRVNKSTNAPGHFIVAVKDFNVDCALVYEKLSNKIINQQIPGVGAMITVSKPEGTNPFAKRKYFMIERKGVVSYVCAAPFGTDFFFSLWTLERITLTRWILTHIPVLGPILERTFWKMTFYKIDSFSMFNTMVHEAFKDVMNEVTDGRISREYSKEELRPVLKNVFDRR